MWTFQGLSPLKAQLTYFQKQTYFTSLVVKVQCLFYE